MTTITNINNLRQYKTDLIAEHIPIYASSTNLDKEVKNSSQNLKQIT